MELFRGIGTGRTAVEMTSYLYLSLGEGWVGGMARLWSCETGGVVKEKLLM